MNNPIKQKARRNPDHQPKEEKVSKPDQPKGKEFLIRPKEGKTQVRPTQRQINPRKRRSNPDFPKVGASKTPIKDQT
jgi:hypothetical protein